MKKCIGKNGKEIIIRKATKEDANTLISYIQSIAGESDFLTFGEGEFNLTVEQEEGFIEECVKSENMLCIIATMNDKIVGNLSFRAGQKPRIKHTGELGVSVLRDYWGLGIGKLLMLYLINWAKESNVITKINLRVREDNEKAIRIYKDLGFKEEGNISRDIKVNGIYYNCIMMGMKI